MQRPCTFCGIVQGRLPSHKVYEDERVVAFLDIHPSAPGHTLIVPKVHEARIENLSEENAAGLFRALHALVGRIQAAVGAPASTVGINNGPESGQEVPHVHIHVIPRMRGDRGGIVQGVARGGHRPNDEEMRQIAERIRKSSEAI
jgi:histidine triad (HIT) family protein